MRLLYLLPAAIAMLLPSVVAQAQGTPTFFDETFLTTDWASAKISDTTPSQDALGGATQSPGGGNPGAYWSIFHSWCGDGMGSDGLVVFHLRRGFVWDPAVDGPIDSLSYSYDVIFSPVLNPFAVAISLAVRQNGNDYGVYRVATLGNWTTLDATGIHVGDFTPYTPGAPALDFSPTGAPVQFGLISGNATGNSECLTTASGVDNYAVTITSTSGPQRDAGPPDAAVADAELADGGNVDAGTPDTGTPDAGAPADATLADIGAPPDAGSPRDAAADAGAPSIDAGGPSIDAGLGDTTQDEGCGCRATPHTARARPLALLFTGLLASRRRRAPVLAK